MVLPLREQYPEITGVLHEIAVTELSSCLPVDELFAAFDDAREVPFRVVFEFVVVSNARVVRNRIYRFDGFFSRILPTEHGNDTNCRGST
ncbi:hypothetical protein BG842_25780 [Haladaptatus sp. W1]|nr:hypothetical protein BG842_25780 [Haladaptatus sp. W1]